MTETLTKAFINCLDDSSLSLTVPFNPTTVKLGRRVTWTEQSVHGQPWSMLQYANGASDTLQVTLLLDETETDGSVVPALRQLYALTQPLHVPGEEGGARPPCVVFSWEEVSFQGVVQSLDTDLLLFDAGGKARRATVAVSLLGRAFPTPTGSTDFFSQPWTLPGAEAGWGG